MPVQTELVILLIEPNKNDITTLRDAFAKLNVDAPRYIVETEREAIAYLAHRGAFKDRKRFPPPTVILRPHPASARRPSPLEEWLRGPGKRPKVAVISLSTRVPRKPKGGIELCGRSTIYHAPFLKPLTSDTAIIILNICRQWQWIKLRRPTSDLEQFISESVKEDSRPSS